jgi:hypothetical protein
MDQEEVSPITVRQTLNSRVFSEPDNERLLDAKQLFSQTSLGASDPTRETGKKNNKKIHYITLTSKGSQSNPQQCALCRHRERKHLFFFPKILGGKLLSASTESTLSQQIYTAKNQNQCCRSHCTLHFTATDQSWTRPATWRPPAAARVHSGGLVAVRLWLQCSLSAGRDWRSSCLDEGLSDTESLSAAARALAQTAAPSRTPRS